MELGLKADEELGLISGHPGVEVLGFEEPLEMRTNDLPGSPEPTVGLRVALPLGSGSADRSSSGSGDT